MSLFSVAGMILKLFGFAQWAEKMFARHEEQKRVDEAAKATERRAQDVADLPLTKKDRTDAAEKGEL